MKKAYKIVVSIILMASFGAAAFGQTGYSITDNNRDVTSLDQQYYSFDLATGQGTLITNLVVNGQQIRREYEGFGSIGSTLFGMAEFDTENCGTGSDPITGLSADLRMFRTNTVNGTTPPPYPLPNTVQSAIGPQIGELCAPAGFTEAAGAYNPIDGFLYYIASDDTLPASAPRSRIFRVSPTTGLATQIGAAAGITLTAGSGGDENPYFDGLAILPDGRAFATEARFTNNPVQSGDPAVADNGGLYRVFLTGPNAGRATFVKYLFNSDVNRDTGLANNGLVLYVLLEDGRVYTTDSSPGGAIFTPVFPNGNPAGSNTLSTPGCLRPIQFPGQFCGDFEGFEIPNNGNGLR
ncbi:MAG: hypothetical protein AB7Q37_10860 [Pyrinomonadaceae bacterium]